MDIISILIGLILGGSFGSVLAYIFIKKIQHSKEKEIIDQWRGMPSPQFGRHLSNHVEPEVVEALRNAVVASYPKLSHRYYELKRDWMGLEYLEIWDRNAPLPIESNQTVPWKLSLIHI